MLDCITVMPYSSRPIEENSEGELDGEPDIDDDSGTDGDEQTVRSVEMEQMELN
jgi:hypothetical protein